MVSHFSGKAAVFVVGAHSAPKVDQRIGLNLFVYNQ